MIFSVNSKEKLLYILVNRTAIFLFLLCLLALFLYAAGTRQGFVDSTQIFLLNLSFILGIFLAIASIPGLILDLGRLLKTRKSRYLFRAAGYVLLAVFGAAVTLAVSVITAISAGVQ